MPKPAKKQMLHTHPSCFPHSKHLSTSGLDMWRLLVYEQGDEKYLPKQHYLTGLPTQSLPQVDIRGIIEKLCREHTAIGIDANMLGGMPHIKGFRLSVGNILAKIYHYGSIEKVREIYPDISESHIKEAIAFAQDFLENACASSESY